MTDIPEHLTKALRDAEFNDVSEITAVLAALRPEDAHLVPAWKLDLATMSENYARAANYKVERSRYESERDEARAEVARWHAKCDEVGIPYDPDGLVRHHRGNAGLAAALESAAEIARLDAEAARWRLAAEAHVEIAKLEAERDEARAEVERLKRLVRIADGAIGDGGRSG